MPYTAKHPIHAFQTGRFYGQDGQRVAWTVTYEHDNGWSEVVFFDCDRYCYGTVVLPKRPADIRNADILFMYDCGSYSQRIQHPDVECAVRDAARAVPSAKAIPSANNLPRGLN